MMPASVTDPITHELALELCDLRKVYGGVVALAGATMSVRSGEIHGLLGANGAGKSTIVRLVAGAVPQDHERSACSPSNCPFLTTRRCSGTTSLGSSIRILALCSTCRSPRT